MKPLYFIIAISVTLLIFYLILYSLTYTICIEGLDSDDDHHSDSRSSARYTAKNQREVSDLFNKKKEKKDSPKGDPFKWPTKKEKKVTHTHPALLYYNSNGEILPVEHGHKLTETSLSNTDINDSPSNTTFIFGQKVNNARHVKLKGKKYKHKEAGWMHYSMPLPLNDDKEIIDITSNSKYLSPALWKDVNDSEAEGYLYPYNIINRFDKNAIDITMPYGKQVHDKLQDQNPSDSRYFRGIKHTHIRDKKHGTAKGEWHLKKRKIKNKKSLLKDSKKLGVTGEKDV